MAGEAESKGQSPATCTVYCPLQRRRQRGFRAEFTYVRPRTYTFVHIRLLQTRSGSPLNACIFLVNYAVYSESRRRMFLSWRIASVNPPSTFRSFFSGQVQDLCERSDELSEVFVGKAKDHLDLVELI